MEPIRINPDEFKLENFINYYKLEKDFQTQYVLNPRVKPNINNNK